MSFDIGQTVECDHTDYNDNNELVVFDQTFCPKCLGRGYYYDFALRNGDVEEVVDFNLLEELAVKYISVEKFSDRLHKSFGTEITKFIGELGGPTEALRRRLEREVLRSLSTLKFRQAQQEEIGQEVTDDEALARVDSVDVRFTRDPRHVVIEVVLTNRAGQTSSIQITT